MNYNEMTKEELIQLLEDSETTSGKYGLIWDKEKEPEQIVADCNKNIQVLRANKNKSIVDSNVNNSNILIEGDNFHSLSVLNYTHKEKIDIIYIDPPYNTGNKDFIYNDTFIEYDDGYRHSKWLNFMEKRLKLAKNLLSENGIIYISIDDNELYQLKLLCDKIFGEDKFLANISVETSNGVFGLKAKHINKTVVKCKDYVLVYAMNKNQLDLKPLYSKSKASFDTHFTYYKNDDYECNLIDFLKSNDLILSKSKLINITPSISNLSMLMNFFPEINDLIISEAKNIYRIRDYTLSITSEMEDKLSDGNKHKIDDFYVFKNNDGLLLYLYPFDKLINKTDDYHSQMCSSVIVGDLWKGFNDDMGNVGKEGGIDFKNGKKPVRLIKNLIKMFNKTDALILDFFAGSGTTGQAVLELNKEDGGNRQFILCTNNENGICEDKTYPRLKNIIKGYNNYEGYGGNLEYFQTDFVENCNNKDQLYYDLTEKCIPMLCLKDGNYIEYKITVEYKIFSNKDKTKFTCVYHSLFGEKETEFVNELENISQYKTIYKFSLGDNVDKTIFKNVSNYDIEPIPYKIIELYKRIVKMSRED